MKLLIIGVTLAAFASTAPLNAQILPAGRIPSTSRGGTIDGSWYPVGRDGNGNAIYERRTRDGNGNIVVQRARRDGNGNLTIISTRTVLNNDDRRDCDFARTTNTVGDIILGRSSTGSTNCRDDRRNRVDGGWYQVGRGRNNNSIWERRTHDANGNVVIQRARRNADGTFTVFSTRVVRNGDDRRIGRGGDDDDRRIGRDRDDDDDQGENEHDRGRGKGHGHHGSHGHGDDDDDDRSFSRGDDGFFGSSNAVLRGNGRGRGQSHGKHGDRD